MTSEELLRLGKETNEMDFVKEYHLPIITDDEIINILSLCKEKHGRNCVSCSLYKESGCVEKIASYALDLITCLKNEAKKDNRIIELQDKKIAEQKAEIERLSQPILMADNVEINKEELLEKLQQSPIQILPGDDTLIRVKAIEEFWTKVRAYAVVMGCYHIVEYGDGVVKEMVGEQNG